MDTAEDWLQMNQGIFPESSAKEERNEKYEREIKETEYKLSSSIILYLIGNL